MGLFARLIRLVWGDEVDRALRPVLAVGLAGSIAGGAMYPFLGIWAIKLAPSAWGFLLIINPILVTLFQLRLTRGTAGISPALKLGIGLPLMGLPFLLLNVSAAIPVVAAVVLVFVVGEMLWIPTSQAVVSALAPADIRGAYMGVFGSSWAVAWALAPFFGLQVRAAFGDSAMWFCVAALSVVAGVTGAAAAQGRRVQARKAVASTA